MLKTAVQTLVAVGAAVAQSSYDDERFREWGRVYKLQPGQQIVARPFKAMRSKAFATFVSSDAAVIVVRLRNDRKLEISKDRIRPVVRRKRTHSALLTGAGTGCPVIAFWTVRLPDLVQPFPALLFGGTEAALFH